MKVSVDGGGLCADQNNKYGNYTFIANLIRALSLYDAKNNYFIYSFCRKPENIKLPSNFNFQSLKPKRFWMKLRVAVEELKIKKDIFLAINQALPIYTESKIISFSHGLSYYFYPKFYKSSLKRLKSQLSLLAKKSEHIVVSSQKVKDEFIEIKSSLKDKLIVIPFGIPFDMQDFSTKKREKYFMFVGGNTPIKNIKFIIEIFKEFNKKREFSDFKLFIVSPKIPGLQEKNIFNITAISRLRLKNMYARASGYLTASYYESFNFPVLEALSQKCPVVGLKSAIIPELKNYVYVADNKDEFIEKMNLVAEGKSKKISLSKLRKDFSWNKYVKKLISLY